MSYTFRQQLLDPKRYKYMHPTTKKMVYKSAFSLAATTITVHNTANDAPAANEANYHNRADNHNSVSYHVAVDDKEIVQVLPFNRNAYHAGDGSTAGGGNRTSIGIEICYSKSGGERYVKAEENAVQYIAKLLYERGWGVDRLRQHYDWSKKNCPHRIRNEGRWSSFVQRVQVALNNLKNPVKEEPTMLQPTYQKDAPPSEWAKEAVEWAQNTKPTPITDGTYLQRPATREEVLVMLHRMAKVNK